MKIENIGSFVVLAINGSNRIIWNIPCLLQLCLKQRHIAAESVAPNMWKNDVCLRPTYRARTDK